MDPEKTHHRQLRKLLRMASTMAGDGKSTPRIKSGNCSVTFNSNNASSKSASTAGATASSSTSDIYDKQMVWKLHGQRKVRLLACACVCLKLVAFDILPIFIFV